MYQFIKTKRWRTKNPPKGQINAAQRQPKNVLQYV